ncbi:hypothetical protein ACFGOO_02075, partial [Treponema vincentii]|uniref:hypothetical protein n=1 Tax=Treponema vincentii TaxID=69710 RepID=UPI0035F5CC80
HSSQLTAHSSQLTAHSSQLTAHSSQRKSVFLPVKTKRQDLTKEILFAISPFFVILRLWKSENK